jgi:phosphatidate cytidylyltransferase
MHAALNKRLLSAAVLSAAVLSAAFWAPAGILLAILLAVCTMAFLEFYSFLDAADIPHFKCVGTVGGLVLMLVTWASFRFPSRMSPGDWELCVLFLITIVVLLRTFPQRNNPRPLTTIAATLLGVLYIGFLFNFFTKLLMGWWNPAGQPQDGRALIIYMLLVVKFTDAGAYFLGGGFGRHKLMPRISPAKTWEGFAGGLLTGIVVSLIFYWTRNGSLGVVDLSLFDAVLLGALLVFTGTIGDLTESLLKRAAGVKDSSRMIHGMGGVLDVLDSPLFAAPVMYYYVRLFMA